MMLALAIHCTVDGLAMAAGGETGGGEAAAAPAAPAASHATGFTIILAVCVHKIPEGLALGALLLGAGLSRKRIILSVMGVEATTLLGGAVGLIFFPTVSSFWISIALAHAGAVFCSWRHTPCWARFSSITRPWFWAALRRGSPS